MAGDGPAGSLFGDRYALGSVIGVGSSASVYEAEDVQAAGDDRRVAVKILHPHLADRPEAREAFLREAARAEQLRHPNVVAVHDCGLHDAGGLTLAWIALDLVDGPSLADWVHQHGRMPLAEAAAVLDGTLAALGAAHRLGIVHRDVSPRNILLAGLDADADISAAQVRVLDFGLADAAGGTTVGGDVLLAGKAAGGGVVGSAQYMSPEQAQGLPITASGDLYQAGAVLYFLLTGSAPYPRDTVQQVIAAQVAAPAPVPSARVPAARAMDRVVTRAMAKDPSRRYPDTYTFREALRGAIASTVLTGERNVQSTRVIPTAEGVGWPPSTQLAPVRPPEPMRTASAAGARTVTTGAHPLPSTPVEPASDGSPAVGLTVAGIAIVAVLAVASSFLGSQPAVVAAPPSPLAAATPSQTPAFTPPASPTPSPSVPVLVSVPTLYGTLADVRKELKTVGLRLGAVTRADSAEEADRIVAQSLDSGLQVAYGTAVKVTVASGFNTVPPTAGLGFAEAVSALRTAGFTCDDVAPPTPDAVTGSLPSAGARIAVGTAVALVTAGGEPSPPATPDTAPPSPSAGG